LRFVFQRRKIGAEARAANVAGRRSGRAACRLADGWQKCCDDTLRRRLAD
jgi:hypothetical protein